MSVKSAMASPVDHTAEQILRLQGHALWPGVKRLSLEIPIADTSPAADLKLAYGLIQSIPAAAGIPTVVFGSQASTDLARAEDVPFVTFSVEECLNEEEDEEELNGPLIVLGTTSAQHDAVRYVVNQMWSGRLLLVVNAAWFREDLAEGDQAFARSLDVIYFFLPIVLGVRPPGVPRLGLLLVSVILC